MGGLENFVKILKWGGYNKRELAEKNGRKIKGAPPRNSGPKSKLTYSYFVKLRMCTFEQWQSLKVQILPVPRIF